MPVFYFPKFFHPDPTVERKSGFLIPSFGNSKNLGASANIPYFHVISDSADLTFKPRFFSENEYLLQSEFRKEMKILPILLILASIKLMMIIKMVLKHIFFQIRYLI